MNLPNSAWDQLRNKTADELVAALLKDGWAEDAGRGSIRVYRHPDGRRARFITIRRNLRTQALKSLFQDIGWSEADLRRLKLIR